MIIETGHFALILALVVAIVQFAVPMWGMGQQVIRASIFTVFISLIPVALLVFIWSKFGYDNDAIFRNLYFWALVALCVAGVASVAGYVCKSGEPDPTFMRFAVTAAQTHLMLLSISFLSLVWAFATSDFSVVNVFNNSHSLKPMLFKIAAVWGNHEGSMLLWVLILAFYGAMVATFGRNLPPSLKTYVLSIQGLVSVAFLLFLIITSNPFERLATPPLDGKGLNPVLQDFALAIHPPFLYMGYVGFSIAFSFAVAALIEGRVDAAWARWVRPWTLVAWICLTIGIMLGSWWAYYELGWGGWWFWDPVENASFMPWLAGTALLHSALVVEKRGALKLWTILLSILAFSLSLMGTFLVRSGVLSSVHAFAIDPERGVFILGILAFFTGGALTLFAWRAPDLKKGGLFSPISREGALVFNNFILAIGCYIVFQGTLYPLVMQAFDLKRTVAAPYFELYFGLLMIPLLLAMPFGPLLSWKRADLKGASERLYVAAGLGVMGTLFTYWVVSGEVRFAPIIIGIGIYVMAGAVTEILWRAKAFRADWSEVARRLRNLPRASYGGMLGHLGIGLFVVGAVATNVWKTEKIVAMLPGDIQEISGYEVRFIGVKDHRGPNYHEKTGTFHLLKNGEQFAQLQTGKRAYIAPRTATTETGIYNAWTGDLYLALGDELQKGAYTVRIYFNPFVRFIWLGCLVMAFGGMVSLSDRRLRVGAPKRAKRKTSVAPAE